MKKLIATWAIALLSGVSAFAQEHNDSIQQIPRTRTVFAQIMGYNPNILGIGNKIKVDIDFGDERSFWGNDGRNLIIDEDGKDMKFNSMVDAMNFMGERGWVYTDSYVITVAGQNVIHWLLCKEIDIDEDKRGNIKQRRDKKKGKKHRDEFDDPLYD